MASITFARNRPDGLVAIGAFAVDLGCLGVKSALAHPGITVAEQRMAALTRLQLTNRQMASMLGISVDSVHKTRQRLRKRFDLTSDANLEIYIAAI